VIIEDPEHMSILGLLMRGLLETNLARPANAARAARLDGDVAVRAGSMGVTLRFGGGRVVILRDPGSKPRARVQGDMASLLTLVTGGGMAAPVLSRRVRVGGNLLMLLKMLPLIRG
jgi:hypothetical protein